MINIIPIPALKDNYIWAIHSPDNCTLAVVDPGDAAPVISYLAKNNLTLQSILITHHHSDHTAGILPLCEHTPHIDVLGPHEAIPGLTDTLREGDEVSLFEGALKLNVLDIPGHTLGHIAYYSETILFCGDTLFSCGCGRIFEGTPAQMLNSLNKMKALNENTLLYCAHEYTLANLAFAKLVDSHNPSLEKRYQDVLLTHQNNLPSIPISLKTEFETNPFLRCNQETIIQSVREKYPLCPYSESAVFAHLREWKDGFVWV